MLLLIIYCLCYRCRCTRKIVVIIIIRTMPLRQRTCTFRIQPNYALVNIANTNHIVNYCNMSDTDHLSNQYNNQTGELFMPCRRTSYFVYQSYGSVAFYSLYDYAKEVIVTQISIDSTNHTYSNSQE